MDDIKSQLYFYANHICRFRMFKLNNSFSQKVQTNNRKRLKLEILLTSCFLLTTISFPIFAGNYLDELATEAESTANVGANNHLDSAEKKELEKMEEILESKRPSTFAFYKKLHPSNKDQVFEFYLNDKSSRSDRLTHLQEKVMDLYFSQ